MTSVLDENVVYTALDGVNPGHQPDETPWTLFDRIQSTCDRTMMTGEMLRNYYDLAWRRSGTGRWGTPCQSWVDLLTRWRQMSKIELVNLDEMPALVPGSGVKDDDEPVVRIAKGKSAILVSYDEKLQAGAENNGVMLASPTRAIPLIKAVP